jgi:hypothetical protein
MKNIHDVDEYLQKYLLNKPNINDASILIAEDLSRNSVGQNFIDELDIDKSFSDFSSWLNQLAETEPMSREIIGLNFGLFESSDRIVLYISGSKEWDEDDSDWACNNDYFPEERYFVSDTFSRVYDLFVEEETVYIGVFLSLAIVISFICEYKTNIAENKFLKNNEKIHISTGFDDGDLYNIF